MKKTILKKLYVEDQRERALVLKKNIDTTTLIRNDKKRRREARLLYEKGNIKTPADLFFAAMLFHHGISIADARMAKRLAKISMERGFKKAYWLYASATDRLLMKQKKPQKYGTQFFKKNKKSRWVLYKTSPFTSDEERALYNVPPLSEIKENLRQMNTVKV